MTQDAPLMIQEQGSFAIGGTLITQAGSFDLYKPREPAGQTYHGDHAFVRYQIPVQPRPLPLMFLHGAAQFSRSWETTPDGREGFQNIFLRRRYGTYLIDQPRRGGAGRSLVETVIKPVTDEQMWFNQFRFGVWPKHHPTGQFPSAPEAMNQFFRSMTPDTGPFDMEVISDSVAELFNKVGPGILVTHSQGGGPGWLVALKSSNVRAVVAFEPGSGFIFPEGEVPEPMPSANGTLEGMGISLSEFKKLTSIPIVVFFGDFIPEHPTNHPGEDNWRVRLAMAKLWRDAINRHGGDATLVHLPELGIRGNTHFIFSDLNNVEVADQVSKFLSEKHLD